MDKLQQYLKFPLSVAKEAIMLQVRINNLLCNVIYMMYLLPQYAVDCRIDECV